MMGTLADVIALHKKNVGFVEGPNNSNPWGPIQGISNAAYCDSGASVVPFQIGFTWWPESQFGIKGCAYCPTHLYLGVKHGVFMYDHASTGAPADIKTGDLLFYSWSGGTLADHVETAIEDSVGGGRTHNIGYNTGSPEGCHDLWRDRKFLIGRLRPPFYTSAPTPVAPPVEPVIQGAKPVANQWVAPYPPGTILKQGMTGPAVLAIQQRLKVRGWDIATDGVDGPITTSIVKQFQTEKHLMVDGQVGPNTWASIMSTTNVT